MCRYQQRCNNHNKKDHRRRRCQEQERSRKAATTEHVGRQFHWFRHSHVPCHRHRCACVALRICRHSKREKTTDVNCICRFILYCSILQNRENQINLHSVPYHTGRRVSTTTCNLPERTREQGRVSFFLRFLLPVARPSFVSVESG